MRSISKEKPSYKNILSYIEKFTASNIDWSVVERTYGEIIANGIIDTDLKFLISSSCNIDVGQDESIDFVASDESDAVTPLNVTTIKNNRIIKEMKIKNRKIVKL